MEILGVGPLEFLFILILMLLVLGPKGMVKTVRDIGTFLRNIVQSPTWKSIVNSTQELRQVQTQIIKDTGLDESIKEIRESTQSLNKLTNDLVKPVLDQTRIEPISFSIPKARSSTPSASAKSEPVKSDQKTAAVSPNANPVSEPIPVNTESDTAEHAIGGNPITDSTPQKTTSTKEQELPSTQTGVEPVIETKRAG